VCAALLLPSERRRLLEARVIAQNVESPPLQASLELLIDSPEPADLGIFRYLAARVARSPLKTQEEVLYVDIARGEVRRGTAVLHVSDRGLELLTALALLPDGRSKEELAGMIWPSLDGDGALNTLKMCVSRTRAQVADKDVIASTKRGYSLNERVAVDVRGYERLLRSVSGATGLGDSVRRQVEAAIHALEPHARTHATGWAWFAPHAAHLEELREGLSIVLAMDSSRSGEAAFRQQTRSGRVRTQDHGYQTSSV
jgi:hypothetical protein